jgi:hypothetical protein
MQREQCAATGRDDRDGRRAALALLRLLAFFLVVVWAAAPARAEDLVSGRYLAAGGTSVILELDVKSRAAGNLIVHQFFPAEATMVTSAPPAMKFDNGKAKWLIAGVQPGTLRITVELAAPIPAGSVRAEVRCRDRESGRMVSVAIRP